MSNEFVMVPRDALQDTVNRTDKWVLPFGTYEALSSALAKPAEQHQGEPVAWFTDDHLTDKSATTWDSEVAERWRTKGWPVGELFGRADPGEAGKWRNEAHRFNLEVERLRADLRTQTLRADAAIGDANDAERKLAERDAMLQGLIEYADSLLDDCNRAWSRAGRCADDDVHEDADYLRAVKLLSASAEPSEREKQALEDEKRLGIERFPVKPCAPVEIDERAAFVEAWNKRGIDPVEAILIPSLTDDSFANVRARDAYWGWQARAALERKPS